MEAQLQDRLPNQLELSLEGWADYLENAEYDVELKQLLGQRTWKHSLIRRVRSFVGGWTLIPSIPEAFTSVSALATIITTAALGLLTSGAAIAVALGVLILAIGARAAAHNFLARNAEFVWFDEQARRRAELSDFLKGTFVDPEKLLRKVQENRTLTLHIPSEPGTSGYKSCYGTLFATISESNRFGTVAIQHAIAYIFLPSAAIDRLLDTSRDNSALLFVKYGLGTDHHILVQRETVVNGRLSRGKPNPNDDLQNWERVRVVNGGELDAKIPPMQVDRLAQSCWQKSIGERQLSDAIEPPVANGRSVTGVVGIGLLDILGTIVVHRRDPYQVRLVVVDSLRGVDESLALGHIINPPNLPSEVHLSAIKNIRQKVHFLIQTPRTAQNQRIWWGTGRG